VGKKVISIKEDGGEGGNDPQPWEWISDADKIDGLLAWGQLLPSSGRPCHSPMSSRNLAAPRTGGGSREGPSQQEEVS
jgi:hypothetical protein